MAAEAEDQAVAVVAGEAAAGRPHSIKPKIRLVLTMRPRDSCHKKIPRAVMHAARGVKALLRRNQVR